MDNERARAIVDESLDALYGADAAHGVSLATVILRDGEVVAERYGAQPDTVFGAGGPVDADTTLISWSMAKSITHAAVGVLVGDGLLDPDAPAPVPEWRGTDKAAITLQHLLDMRPGLLFVEDYVDDQVSHCLEMLYGEGKDDMAAYAAGLPLVAAPGSTFNYSSGTTNIVSRIVGDVVAAKQPSVDRRAAVETFLHDRIFRPSGITSAIPKFDTVGNWVGSSYVYATARDFGRFGEMYRLGGRGPTGVAVVSAAWVRHAHRWSAHDDAFDYGAHWWRWREFPDVFAAHGYEGQFVIVSPARRATIVHLGKSPIEQRPILTAHLRRMLSAC